jgi:hypothetical protein
MSKKTTRPEPTPAEKLESLESQYRQLDAEVQLTDIKDRVEDLEAQVNGALSMVRELRSKGYLYEPDLENRSLELRTQWAKLRPNLMKELEAQQDRLEQAKKRVDVQLRGARGAGSGLAKTLPRLEDGLADLEAKVESSEAAVRGLYDGFSGQLGKLRHHLSQVKWMMEQAAESTFDWLPDEGVLRAVKANWVRNQEDELEGVLFLTDQRMLFERKETVATKKVLFITTEKEKVQEAMLEFALASIKEAKGENKGLLGHEDHLFIEADSNAPLPNMHFHLDGQDCDLWVRTIQRAKRGEFDNSRIEPISEEEENRLREAPTKCNACGANFNSPLLRGQKEITCSYCGSVTRI